ncbi:DUF2334 domain-containing protein [Methanophagales archaeon]|nr:MAG: DUF2334 domain-containing protein [Methanophagales archaeon]
MRKKWVFLICLILYLIGGFFWCNPWIVKEISGNYVSGEIPEILVNERGEKGDFSWNGHYALIRLEDVNPASDPTSLEECIELLKNKNVPFSIALIPIYKNPEQNETLYLHEKPELIRLIKDSGATIVLHGCTHQYDGETGVDFEFWDEISDGPLKVNNTEYATSKIELALEELEKCGLTAEIWETPHYTSTDEVAKVVSQYFSKIYEGYDGKLTINKFGQIVIPTNLDYVKGDQPVQSVFEMLAKGEYISSSGDKDIVASFFYHPFLGTDYLRMLIGGLKKQGYKFVGPEECIRVFYRQFEHAQ